MPSKNSTGRRKQSGAKNKPLEFFQMYWRDLSADTGHLDLLQFAGYIKILFAYYDNQGKMHERAVRRASDMTDEQWAENRDEIAKFFRVGHDLMWRQSRADHEISKVHETRESNSKAGKASAAKRAAKRKEIDADSNDRCNGCSTVVATSVQPQEDKSNAEATPDVQSERAKPRPKPRLVGSPNPRDTDPAHRAKSDALLAETDRLMAERDTSPAEGKLCP